MKIEKIREEKGLDFLVKKIGENHFDALGFKIITDSEIEKDFIDCIGSHALMHRYLRTQVKQYWGSKTNVFEELGKTYVYFGKLKLSEFYGEKIKEFSAILQKELKDELTAIGLKLRERPALNEDQLEEARECWVFLNIQIQRLNDFMKVGTLENDSIDEEYRNELIKFFNKKYANF